MTETIVHRGPDDQGMFVEPASGLGFGHCRLSIIDLSKAGHQPMASACGRYVIAYNGEIYNFSEIRQELERIGAAPAWRGHSDTEVLLAAIVQWGIHQALERFNGMFAFALFDRTADALYLARDRVGEKPLYYGWTDHRFVFTSELKALHQLDGWSPEICRGALASYLRHGYVPTPHSIFRGIQKLVPGTALRIDLSGAVGHVPKAHTYWSAQQIATEGCRNREQRPPRDIMSDLEQTLRAAVSRRMVADVPLGAFLSGGFDSSLVVALMQSQSNKPIKTFTIGFHEKQYNEANFAKAVATHLKTDHTELYVTAEEAQAVIPHLPRLYDEPFADSSQIPTFLISQLAKRDVTVALTGDAGDELFAGYDRYHYARNVWNWLSRIPRPLRPALSGCIDALPDAFLWQAVKLMPETLKLKNPIRKKQALTRLLSNSSHEVMYREIISKDNEPDLIAAGAKEAPSPLTTPHRNDSLSDCLDRMMLWDTVDYLPDDILVKVDRAAMGVSLETRIPLLDPDVISAAWSLPLDMKYRDGQGKWALRQVLYNYVPSELMDRPKKGFSVPVREWLRGPLADWCDDLLHEQTLKNQGYFEPGVIRQRWQQHRNREVNWDSQLWPILMFQAWLTEQNSTSTN